MERSRRELRRTSVSERIAVRLGRRVPSREEGFGGGKGSWRKGKKKKEKRGVRIR